MRSTLATAFAALIHPVRSARASRGARDGDASAELDVRRMETFGFARKFCAALAHEISTPLGVITGRIMLALRKLPPDSAAGDDLRVMLAQTERVAQVIQHALEPLRPPPPRLSPIDPRELLASIVLPFEQLAEALSVTLTASLTTDAPRIRADSRQLTCVVTTGLLNALEVTPPGGRVTLALRRSGCDGRREDIVAISITDGGPGVSPALLGHVFDPLYLARAATHEVSLALSSARDIVRAHGGDLRVDSEVGAGTTVTLELPAIQEDSR